MNRFNEIRINRRHMIATNSGIALTLPARHMFGQTLAATPGATPTRDYRLSESGVAQLDDLLQQAVDGGVIAGGVFSLDLPNENHTVATGLMDTETEAPMNEDAIFRIQSMTKAVTAVVMLQLIHEGKFTKDDPVDEWLPELADRQVLLDPDDHIEDTEPANRPISIDDLLTFRSGYGMMLDQPPSTPMHVHMTELGIAPGANLPQESHESWLAKFSDVPLLHQPGSAWRYDTDAALEGILISRVEEKPLSEVLQERVFGPLEMTDTGYFVPEEKIDRLPTAYMLDHESGEQAVFDPAVDGTYSSPPVFEAGNDGLVSTAADWNRFGRLLLNMGESDGTEMVPADKIELMTTDRLTAEQKAVSPWYPGFWDTHGWGYGVSVTTASADPAIPAGQYGWDGGLGTTWFNDPNTGLVASILTQQMLDENLIGLLMQFQQMAPAAVESI